MTTATPPAVGTQTPIVHDWCRHPRHRGKKAPEFCAVIFDVAICQECWKEMTPDGWAATPAEDDAFDALYEAASAADSAATDLRYAVQKLEQKMRK